MPTTYSLPDDDVLTLLTAAFGWHARLRDAGVRVGVLMASNDSGPAVKHGGYPCIATVKVVSLKDRVTKGYDAELLIDRREWDGFREEQHLAILDHELSHLRLVDLSPRELAAARAGDSSAPDWKLDDLGRPRLRTVPGDFHAGDGFDEVVARHGSWAVEYTNLRRAMARADRVRAEGGHEQGKN